MLGVGWGGVGVGGCPLGAGEGKENRTSLGAFVTNSNLVIRSRAVAKQDQTTFAPISKKSCQPKEKNTTMCADVATLLHSDLIHHLFQSWSAYMHAYLLISQGTPPCWIHRARERLQPVLRSRDN